MKAWEIWTGPLFGSHPVLLLSRKIIQGLALAGL